MSHKKNDEEKQENEEFSQIPPLGAVLDQSFARPLINTRSSSQPSPHHLHTIPQERGPTRSVPEFSIGYYDTAGPFRSTASPLQQSTGSDSWGVQSHDTSKSIFGGKHDLYTQSSHSVPGKELETSFSSLNLNPPSFGSLHHKPSLATQQREKSDAGPRPNDFARMMAENPTIRIPPSPAKFLLSPQCSFEIQGSINDTLLQTAKFFDENRMDYKFHTESPGTGQANCLFDCFAYESCYEIRFHVYFYSLGTPDGLLVEFMRRSGDCVFFSSIYRKGRRALKQNDASPLLPAFGELPPEHSKQDDSSTREAVHCLKRMAKSPCVDVKYEGIRGLAQMSRKNENATIMSETGCVDLFVESLESDLTNVHRCAVTGIANLADKATEDTKVVYRQRGVPGLLKLVSSSETLEVLRECARALETICRKLGTEYVRSRGTLQVVQKLIDTPDATVYDYGMKLADAFR